MTFRSLKDISSSSLSDGSTISRSMPFFSRVPQCKRTSLIIIIYHLNLELCQKSNGTLEIILSVLEELLIYIRKNHYMGVYF